MIPLFVNTFHNVTFKIVNLVQISIIGIFWLTPSDFQKEKTPLL